MNVLNCSATLPQLIIGVIPALKCDISVLNQQLVCWGLLKPLAREGIILHVLHVFRHLHRISLPELISLGSSYSQWRETGISGCDLSDVL